MLKIIQYTANNDWKHKDSIGGEFILSKFYAKSEFSKFLIVEDGGSKRFKYSINEIEVYSFNGSAETFNNFDDLFARLKVLAYPAFYEDGQYIFNPALYDLSQFNNNETDRFAKLSDIVFNGVTSFNGQTGDITVNTDDINEGSTNLYFNTARVLATVLTGLSVLTGGSIVPTDSVLIAFGKIQKQINDLYQALIITTTNFNVLTTGVTNIQNLANETDAALLKARETKILSGYPTIDAGNATFSITAVKGELLDGTDANNPIYKDISTVAINNITPTNANGFNYYYFNQSGTLLQSNNVPTPEELITRNYIARVFTSSGVISSAVRFGIIGGQLSNKLREIYKLIGLSRDSSGGSLILSAGNNLKLKHSAGIIKGYDINSSNNLNPDSKSFLEFDTTTTGTFRYITRAGVNTVNRTDLLPDEIQNATTGAIETLANNKFGVQYVLKFGSSGNVRLVLGDTNYNNITDAVDSLSRSKCLLLVDSTTRNALEDAIILGAIIFKKGTTSTTVDTTFIQTNQRGDFGSGSGFLSVIGSSYIEKNISNLTPITLPIQDTDIILINRAGVEYKVNKSDLITGGVSKKTQIIEFAWTGGGYGGSANWYRLTPFVGKYSTSFQANATINPSNNFADDTNFCFHESLMFNGKIKAITIEGDNNGVGWNCDFALRNFELPNSYNAGFTSPPAINNQLIGRKQFQVGAGGFQTRTFWTILNDFGDILLNKDSIIKPYFKSEGVANSNWQNVVMKILIEEV